MNQIEQLLIEYLSYNPEKGTLKWKKSRGGRKANTKAGTRDKEGYIRVRFCNKSYGVHRIAWFLQTKEWPNEIDHINGIKSDNRFCNLRSVTHRQNGQNLPIHRQGQWPGTSFDKSRNRWRARYKLSGKKVHIGWYLTQIEAHLAYMYHVQTPPPKKKILQNFTRE